MFELITDSACDLTPEQARAMQLTVVPFYVSTDGVTYLKEGQEMPVREFYQFMVDHPEATPKTSLPSIEDFEQVFRAKAAAGKEVLCLCFTGKMSGGVGSARNARTLVLEDYPDARIEVLDTAGATVTEAATVENAVSLRDAGCTLDEALTWLNGVMPTNQIFFTVGNLDYLIKGGRIGKVAGRAANFLGVKPMIHFKEGEIFSGGVARGRQKSFEKALDQLLGYLTERNAGSSWAMATTRRRASGSGCRPAPPSGPSTPAPPATWGCSRSARRLPSIPGPIRWAWAWCGGTGRKISKPKRVCREAGSFFDPPAGRNTAVFSRIQRKNQKNRAIAGKTIYKHFTM